MQDDLIPATESTDSTGASRFRPNRVIRSLAPYGLVLALTLLVLTLALRLWNLDFHVPTNYGGDGTLHLMFTKGLLENGWYLTNPSLGAPGEMDLREFPAVDTLPALLTKGLGLFTHDPALLNNLLFLLTFPLASLAAFHACRQMGLLTGPSLLCALLYAFAQYHFVRSEGHLYLSAYFMAPLATLVAWWIAEGRLLGPAGAWRRGRLALAGGICVLTSLSGAYYPFFAGIILVTASLLALCARRDRRHFVAGTLLTALLVAGLLTCLLPTLLYLHRHPGQPAAGMRRPEEAEIFGLKIAQVLLPIDGHRLGAVDRFKARYDRHSPLVNENSTAAVGVVGAAGFLVLIGWLLFRPVARAAPPGRVAADDPDPPPGRRFLDTFSVFNAAAVLFGTIGGFGELFALFVSPQIRALNRLSVFIDFFALATVAFCLDALLRPRRGSRAARVAGGLGLGALGLLGLLDQTRPINPVAYRVMSHDYRADRDFFRRAAASLPAGSLVFQLPYMGFPENGPEGQLQDYSLFGGYVLSNGLRWSYGAMRDSPGDQWQQAVARLPLEAGVRQLALAGFSGIHVERAGYADFGAALTAGLRDLLGPPVATQSERVFFSLLDYNPRPARHPDARTVAAGRGPGAAPGLRPFRRRLPSSVEETRTDLARVPAELHPDADQSFRTDPAGPCADARQHRPDRAPAPGDDARPGPLDLDAHPGPPAPGHVPGPAAGGKRPPLFLFRRGQGERPDLGHGRLPDRPGRTAGQSSHPGRSSRAAGRAVMRPSRYTVVPRRIVRSTRPLRCRPR